MAENGKKTIKEFADEIRQQVDVPEGMDDETLVRKIIEVKPDVINQLQSSISREGHNAPQGGSSVGRFFEGLGARLPIHKTDWQNKGQIFPNYTDVFSDKYDKQKTSQYFGGPKSAGQTLKEGASEFLDLPGIHKDLEKGNISGAIGRATTSAASVVFPARGAINKLRGAASTGAKKALEESLAMGAEQVSDKAARALSKGVAAPHNALLDSQIADIDQAMTKEMTDVQTLRVNLAKATNAIERSEKAVGTAVKDYAAAKDVVDQISARLNPPNPQAATGQTIKVTPKISWPELRQYMKRLNAARQEISDPSIKNQLSHMVDGMKTELQKVADKAGQGPQFKKWTDDYAQLSELQRKYAAALRGKTEPQLINKQTASEGRKVVGVPIGKSKTNKTAAFNKKHIDTFHKAFDQLHDQIKTKPKVPLKPPQPLPPSQTPPAQPPPTSGKPGAGMLRGNLQGQAGPTIGGATHQLINEINKASNAKTPGDQLRQITSSGSQPSPMSNATNVPTGSSFDNPTSIKAHYLKLIEEQMTGNPIDEGEEPPPSKPIK